ncbi:MAG: hypothetical protein IPO62_14685 [Saprospiraceae bacterium]|nr:hypothetical protein [Saprospiraceae bacterium]
MKKDYELRPSVKKDFELRPSVKKDFELGPSMKKDYELRPSSEKGLRIRAFNEKGLQKIKSKLKSENSEKCIVGFYHHFPMQKVITFDYQLVINQWYKWGTKLAYYSTNSYIEKSNCLFVMAANQYTLAQRLLKNLVTF